MKFTLKAGIALTALSGAVAMAGSSFAADLGGSIKDGYVQPMPQVSRGPAGPCYFRADVGYSVSQDPEVKWPVNNREFAGDTGDGYGGAPNGIIDADEITSLFVTDAVSNTSLDNTWFGQVGAGCSFGSGSSSRGLRGEFMLGRHGDRKLDGEPGFYLPGPDVGTPVPGYVPDPELEDPLHSNITSYSAMVNAYYDLGQFGRVTPYVGAGMGISYNILDEVYFTDNPALTNRIDGNRDISFAWALMAGIGYQVSDRAILDFGYRYVDLGSIESGRVDSAGFVNPAVEIDDLAAHEFKVGLRYSFGSSDCCTQQYVPMK